MSIIAKVKEVLPSKYFVIGAAAVAGVIVWMKGMPFVAGVALGVTGTKLISALRG